MIRLLLLVLCSCGRIGFEPGIDAASETGPRPVARYLLDDDPTDGVEDATDNGHTGTCSPCPPRIPAIDDAGYLFAGELIHVASAPELESPAVSVAAWLRPDAVPGCVVNKLVGPTIGNSWQLCINSALQLSACVGDGAGCAFSQGTSFVVGGWRHITLTFDGATMEGWVGGQRVISAARTMPVDGGDILIGGDIDNGATSLPFRGVIDDVRIWDRKLTDAEILQLVIP